MSRDAHSQLCLVKEAPYLIAPGALATKSTARNELIPFRALGFYVNVFQRCNLLSVRAIGDMSRVSLAEVFVTGGSRPFVMK